jgi:hypothetical protein
MNADDGKAEATIDWVEASRVARELALCHGRAAHIFAASLADEAESTDDSKAAQFWRAVSRSLAPRA